MSKITLALQRFNWLPNIVLLFTVCVLAWWTADRREPFVVKSYMVSNAKPGGFSYITGDVDRNLSWGCSVQYNRYLFDSLGYRWDILSNMSMSAEALEQMDAITPGKVKLTVPVPAGAPTGPAKVVTMLTYTCNPVHRLWPVQQVWSVPFFVE